MIQSNESHQVHFGSHWIKPFFVIIFVFILIRTAWVCDDAYITLRTVDNFIHGYGLTWNISERVQAYTHPLWMFLVSGVYVFLQDGYWVLLGLNILCSSAALVLLLRLAGRNVFGLFIGFLLLLNSKAFMDYSTSGLENALNHLLLAGFAVLYFNSDSSLSRWRGLIFLSALVALTRIDLWVLLLPPLVGVAGETRKQGHVPLAIMGKAGLIGLLPFIAWEIFSLIYYGFPFPNTAYAKLYTSIPQGQLIQQGFCYLLESLRSDPLTLLSILMGLILGFRSGVARDRFLFSGVAFFLVYLILIGGDFMNGRFLTPVFFVTVLWLVRQPLGFTVTALCSVLILILGLTSPGNPLRSGEDYADHPAKSFWKHNGIADERGFFYQTTGLLKYQRGGGHLPKDPHYYDGQIVRERTANGQREFFVHSDGTVGFYGYAAGPNAHIVDIFCLADPLLARLPSIGSFTGKWRVGHYTRFIPSGYIETLRSGTNAFLNPRMAEFYSHIARITTGPLWTFSRWRSIFYMNLRYYDSLVYDQVTLRPPDFQHQIGQLTIVPGSRSEKVLQADPLRDQPLRLAYGQFLTLHKGSHQALFRMKIEPAEFAPPTTPARLDLAVDGGRTIIAETHIPPSLADGNWHWIEIPFEVKKRKLKFIEARVHFTGITTVALDEVLFNPICSPVP